MRRQAPIPTKPPTTKKSGMICAIQVTGPIQFVSRSVRSMTRPRPGTTAAPIMSMWPTTTTTTQSTRTRSMTGSRAVRPGMEVGGTGCARLAHGPSDSAWLAWCQCPTIRRTMTRMTGRIAARREHDPGRGIRRLSGALEAVGRRLVVP